MACAFVGPIPGSASNCSAVAVLILTVWPGANLPVDEPVGDTVLLPDGSLAVVDLLDDLLFGDAEVSVVVVSGVVVFFEDFVVDFLVVVVPVPNVILSWIASIFDFESPLTFDKSSTLW